MESKLYVGNLSLGVTEEDLWRLFGQAGEIKQVTLVLDRYTRQPKDFGFVEMVNQGDAQKAIRMFDNHDLDGQRLNVSFARPREERSTFRVGSRRRAGRGR